YSKSHISLYFLPVLTAESSLSQCKFLPLPMVISTASPLWNLLWEFTQYIYKRDALLIELKAGMGND
ncbi:MAG: hypothetical protein IKH21_05915, partial [Clostridia bacterium]|nr:hypothetical protein [Clostridia bacterium]